MMIEEYLTQQMHGHGQPDHQEDMTMVPAVTESYNLAPVTAAPAPSRGHQRRHRRAVTEPNFDFLYKQQQRERDQDLLGLGPSSPPKPDLLNTMAHSFVKQEQMRVLSSGNLQAQGTAAADTNHDRSVSVVSLEESAGSSGPKVSSPPQAPHLSGFPQNPQPSFGMASAPAEPAIHEIPQITPCPLEPQLSLGTTTAPPAEPDMFLLPAEIEPLQEDFAMVPPATTPFPLEPQPSAAMTTAAAPDMFLAPAGIEPVQEDVAMVPQATNYPPEPQPEPNMFHAAVSVQPVHEDATMMLLDPLMTNSGDNTDPLMEIDIEPVVMSSTGSEEAPSTSEGEPSRLSRFLDKLQSVADQQTILLQQQQQQQQQQRKRHRRAVSEGPTRFDLSNWGSGFDNNQGIANTMMMKDHTEDAALFGQQW